MMRKIVFILTFIICSPLYPQAFYRIKADFSIKVKTDNGNMQLTMGKVYYDKNKKILIYDISFPEKETWVQIDTNTYRIKDKLLKETIHSPNIAEFSIFHLSLNGNLPDYGLKRTIFNVSKVEKEKDMVITTWKPSDALSKTMWWLKLSTVDKKLFGIVFYDANNNIVRKQFFEDYSNTGGFVFPGKIVQITYLKGKENYEITTYKNIVTNDTSEEYMYNFVVPGL